MNAWEDLNSEVAACRLCPRLVAWREQVAAQKKRAYRLDAYWGRPVPGFGQRQARLLIVALAPAAHGANRTGRMFTGDRSGDFLFAALHRAGFASQPVSLHPGDGLELRDCYITNVVRCAPPQNRPATGELANCRAYLGRELALMPDVAVVLTLGRYAWDGYLAVLRELEVSVPRLQFAHGMHQIFPQPLPDLVASYHPSRQNTQTGRLTPEMLDGVLGRVRVLMEKRDETRETRSG